MPMVIYSPYSGRQVKVRDQDVGRAIKDEEGRIFYIVERSDGQGYYASPTRNGSEKDEKRYLDMISKSSGAEQTKRAEAASMHDATGKGRGSPLGKLVGILIVLLLIVAALYVGAAYTGMLPEGVPNLLPSQPQQQQQPQQNNDSGADAHQGAPVTAQTQTRSLVRPVSNQTSAQDTESADAPMQSNAHMKRDTETRAVETKPAADNNTPDGPTYIETASGAQYRVTKPGEGGRATAGKYVVLSYKATAPDRSTVASRTDENPVGFVLWSGQAPRVWDEVLAGMRVGGERSVIVSSEALRGEPFGAPGQDGRPVQLQVAVQLLDVRPGVTSEVIATGDGPRAQPGDTVAVHYTAYIVHENGEAEQFDTTRPGREPMRFRLGAGEVIAGWDLGIAGMREGGERMLTIPPYLAYGERGAGGVVPPNATLRFKVELVRVANEQVGA